MKMLLLLTLSLNVFAQDGFIFFSKGDVFINGKKSLKDSQIKYNDKITTGNTALAIISLKPATKIKLKANSSLVIKKPRVTKSTKLFSFVLSAGEAFIKATRTRKNRYNVRTKHAVMGVRGTQFFVSTSPKKDSKDWMCVNEGQVEVKVNDTKGFVLVNAGEGVAISKEQLPKVKQYKWTKALNWSLDGNYEEVKDNTDIQNMNYTLENIEYE